MTPDDVTIGQVVLWVAAIAAFLGSAGTIWAFLSRGSKRNAERIMALDDRLDAALADIGARANQHESRISRIEQTIAALPAKEDMHALQLELARMSGHLGVINATMEGNAKVMSRLEAIVSRHEDHLLSGAKP